LRVLTDTGNSGLLRHQNGAGAAGEISKSIDDR
jgi:hypothetical protein